jgi:hypothetical protein
MPNGQGERPNPRVRRAGARAVGKAERLILETLTQAYPSRFGRRRRIGLASAKNRSILLNERSSFGLLLPRV